VPADVNLGIDITKKGSGDEEAAVGLEALAKAADNAQDQLGQLDRKLLETRAAMVAAGRTFQETGDISPLKALLKDERQLSTVQKSVSRGAEAIAADLARAGETGGQGFVAGVKRIGSDLKSIGTEFGDQAGKLFSGGFFSTLGNIASTPAGFGVLAGAAAVIVPELGATISGALIAGVGGAGLAAGIAAQFNDARVKGAVSGLVAWAKSQLDQATSGFAPQLAAGFAALQREAQPFFNAIRQPLQDLSPLVANLLARLGEGLARLGPGLAHALEAAGPILERIGADIPMLLGSIGGLLDQIASHAKGAGEAIDLMFHVASIGVSLIGGSLTVLTNVFNAILQGADAVTGFMAKIPGIGKEWAGVHQYVDGLAHSMDGLGMSAGSASGSASGLTGSLHGVAGAAQATAAAVASSQAAISTYQSAALGVDQANLAASQSFLDLDASVKQHGRDLRDNTAAGIANRQAIDASIGTLQHQRDAAIAAAGGQNASREAVDAANKKYADQIGLLIDHTGKLFGDKNAVSVLIGTIAGIPNSHMTNIEILGIAQAEGGLSSIAAYLNSIPSVKRISIISTAYTVAGTTPGGGRGPVVAQRYGGVIEHAASGLLKDARTFSAAASGALYAFAEPKTGGEAFIPKHGDLDRSRAIWSYVGQNWLGMGRRGGYGGIPVPHSGGSGGGSRQVTVQFAGNSDSAFATAFMQLVRTGLVQIST